MLEVIIAILGFCARYIAKFFSNEKKSINFSAKFSVNYFSTTEPQKEGEENGGKNS